MRKPFVAGNWKENTDSRSSVELAKAVAAGDRSAFTGTVLSGALVRGDGGRKARAKRRRALGLAIDHFIAETEVPC